MKITLTPVVWVEIQGDAVPGQQLLNDHGVGGRFRQWAFDNGIYSVGSVGYGGAGRMGNAYPIEHLPKIKEWFKANS